MILYYTCGDDCILKQDTVQHSYWYMNRTEPKWKRWDNTISRFHEYADQSGRPVTPEEAEAQTRAIFSKLHPNATWVP
jgi:hypothetical protein